MSEYVNELRDSAKQVVDGTGVAAAEAVIWPLVAELGWLLTTVPEELDGLGMGVQEACALFTELGRGLDQSPFLPAMLAVDALCQSSVADKADLVMRFATGECVTAPLSVPAITLDSSAGTLSGMQAALASADNASHALFWTAAKDCVVLVPLDQAGVEIKARETWDTTRRLFDVTLQNLALDQQLVLAKGDEAASLIARIETLRDFGLAADSLGASAKLLDITIDHLQTRKQFGRPLALFQALKHRCADMKTLNAGAEALLADSLNRVGADLSSADAQLKAKTVKYLACSAYADVAEDALQLHGGIGMASEHECHLFLKRAMLNEQLGDQLDSYPASIADSFLSAQG